MVAVSVRMDKYCPLFFYPSLCFTTYFIPVPGITPLPVNFGPFVLLIITKFIIPRSSLVGHLSGIIIGYPLAWNWLNWLTPPPLIALLLLSVMYKDSLYVWRLPGFDSNPDMQVPQVAAY